MAEQDPASPARIETAITAGPPAIAALDWPADCGAEALFVGRTRAQVHAEYGPLQRLEYELYEPMAQAVLRQIAQQAAAQFGCRLVRIVQARGAVAPGEASVVIQVAAPHRAEAFDACRHLIDRLKRDLPVWKREVWRDGRTFVEGCCAHQVDAAHAGRQEQRDG